MTRLRPTILGIAAAIIATLSLSAEPASAQSWTHAPLLDYDSEVEEASPFWQEALGEHDAEVRDLVRRAREHLRGRRAPQRQAALPLLVAALERAPDDLPANFQIGNYYRLSRKWSKCAQTYSKVFETAPDFAPARESSQGVLDEWLGVCLLYSEQFEGAITHLQRLVTQERESASIQLHLGEALMALGRLDEAIFSFRRAQKLAQSRSRNLLREVEFALAVALDRAEHLGESRTIIKRLTSRDRQLTTLRSADKSYAPASEEHYYLGLAYQGMSNTQRGTYHFRRFLSLAPKSPWQSHAKSNMRERHPSKLAEQLHISGSAQWQIEPLRVAVRKSSRALKGCVAGYPDVLATITLSAALARPAVKHQARAAISAETEVKRETLSSIVECLESAGRKISMPKQSGLIGGHGTAQFVILGTSKR